MQTITSLLGKRNVRPADDLGGSSSSPASAAPLSTSAVTAAPALRPAVRPFANSDELGQAVHSMFGYPPDHPPDHPPDAEVPEEYVKECKATLGSNLDFVRRALCTNEDFFFGPQKELILKLANELAAAAAAPNEPNGVAAAPTTPAATRTTSGGQRSLMTLLVAVRVPPQAAVCLVWAAVRVTGKSRWMHLRQVACSVCLAAWPIKMLCARAHFPRLAACRRHAERRGWWGLSRWYIYHLKWYIYHFEVIWLRVGILLKSQIPVNQKHCPAPRAGRL